MDFLRIKPHAELEKFIECYWMMYSDDTEPVVEKIVPDGYPEIIFNYRDVYRSKNKGDWELQAPSLLAGQLTTFFYLENTGTTGSVAIKLKPASLTQLFGWSMDQYLDQIIDLNSLGNPVFESLEQKIRTTIHTDLNTMATQVKSVLDGFFGTLVEKAAKNPLEKSLQLIFDTNGMVSVGEMTTASELSERQLERLFKKYVGLSPKYYARIIRFNYIFQLIKSEQTNWAEIVFKSGYYDQSHFIRNFKAFTGEDPSAYFFEKKNMANFFLNKE